MPAMKLESIHDDMLTRSEFTPASSVRRGLSTTARMRRPIAVYWSISVSTRNTSAPMIAIARSSRLTNTLWIGLNVWLPCGTMPTALAFVFEPNHRNTMFGHRDEQTEHRHELRGLARGAQEAEQRPVEQEPDGRRDDADREQQGQVHRPVMRDVRVVVDRGHEERHRPERQVEDARRAVRQHQPDRQQRVDAAEGQAEDDRAEELAHARLLRVGRRVTQVTRGRHVIRRRAWCRSRYPA